MTALAVRIFHAVPAASAGRLECELAAARLALAERHRAAFLAAGAADVGIVAVAAERPGGLVVAGSGAMPLATRADLRLFVEAASAGGRVAVANNRYSADAV